MSTVSIIIPTWNGCHLLRECLPSVFSQTYKDFEVIVVDDGGSEDGTLGFVQGWFPQVRLLRLQGRKGFAGACNAGVSISSGSYIVLLGNDNRVDPEWLRHLVSAIQSDPSVGCVMSRSYTEKAPSNYHEDLVGTLNFVGRNVITGPIDTNSVSPTFYASGNALIFKKELADPPFDPSYVIYSEDVFLSWRLRLKGYQVLQAPGSITWHRGCQSTKRLGHKAIFYQERNRLTNLFLFFQRATLVKIFPLVILDVLGALILRRGRFARLGAWLSLLGRLRWIKNRRAILRSEAKVPDSQILRYMSSKIVPDHGLISSLLNKISGVYCTIVGLCSSRPHIR
jgi:hypothetical protein